MPAGSVVGLIFLALSIWHITRVYQRFIQNLNAAKASNIPYIVVPIHWLNRAWRISQPAFVPVFRRLPIRWTDPWLELILDDWTWKDRFALFERLGCDAFLTVSPGGNALYVANAAAINEITTRKNDFPKPIQNYKLLEIYGRNLVSSEGEVWKHHRKIINPLFSEKCNQTVWTESLQQAQSMLQHWFKHGNDDRSPTIDTVDQDVMRLSLHVISRVGFGVQLSWTEIKPELKIETGKDSPKQKWSLPKSPTAQGHIMTYTDAINGVVNHLLLILLVPKLLLRYLPLQKTKKAYLAYTEWGKYMNHLFEVSKNKLASGEVEEGIDFLASLARGAGAVPDFATSPPANKSIVTSKQTLSDSEIIGNVFLFILAGHETTALSLLYGFIYLALHVASQRSLQSDLDRIFQGRSVEKWGYYQDIPKLFNSMAGAVVNEELRLIPPAVIIPKCTLKSQPDQRLTINGRNCTVPAGTLINILPVAAHRNPHIWPAGPPSNPDHPAHPRSNTKNDLEEFKPERWFHSKQSSCGNAAASASQIDLDVSSQNEATTLFRPPKGAFIPFSEGPRSCIGRRFAQTEILAVFAVVFSQYSVELAVDKFASDTELEAMDANEKKKVWEMAKEEAETAMREKMGSIVSLRFRNGAHVPLRFVKRGKETFA